jgi:hypothetical protein
MIKAAFSIYGYPSSRGLVRRDDGVHQHERYTEHCQSEACPDNRVHDLLLGFVVRLVGSWRGDCT